MRDDLRQPDGNDTVGNGHPDRRIPGGAAGGNA
jgi:hypothetical protein